MYLILSPWFCFPAIISNPDKLLHQATRKAILFHKNKEEYFLPDFYHDSSKNRFPTGYYFKKPCGKYIKCYCKIFFSGLGM
jgi:hypothetical protein